MIWVVGFGFGRVNRVIRAGRFGFGRVNPMIRASRFGFAVVNPMIWPARFGFVLVNPWVNRASAVLRCWPSARLAASFAGLRAIFFLFFDSMVNSSLLALCYGVRRAADGSWGCMFMR